MMRELLIVGAIVVSMCVLSGVWFTPWETLYYTGIWVTVLGFVFGVPTGVMYHIRLYQTLHPRGVLPRGWFWRPIQYNRSLLPDERRRVMWWFYVGGFGFLVICVGLLLMGGGVSMAFFRGV